jgi:hypothetical protein
MSQRRKPRKYIYKKKQKSRCKSIADCGKEHQKKKKQTSGNYEFLKLRGV